MIFTSPKQPLGVRPVNYVYLASKNLFQFDKSLPRCLQDDRGFIQNQQIYFFF
jgi:hypothetical protein